MSTEDHDLAIRAIEEFRPARVKHLFGNVPMTASAIGSARTLQQAIDRLEEVPHLRSAVILIGPGLTSGIEEDASATAREGAFGRSELLTGVELSHLREAAYGRVPIYPISNVGLSNEPSLQGAVGVPRYSGNDYLRTLAEESGGYAVVNTNDPRPGVAQILAENAHHYVVSYQPTYPVNDNRYRRIDVRAKGGALRVSPSVRYFKGPRTASHQVNPSARQAISSP